MKNKGKRISPLFTVLSVIIVGFFAAGIIMPDKSFSENENKVLAGSPEFSLDRLLDGRFTSGYEDYISDQFPLRDEWIGAKSLLERALFKTENNGVAYGADGYLFPKMFSFDEEQLAKNLEAVRVFAENSPCDVYFAVVPSSSYILKDLLPEGLPSVDEGYFIGEMHEYLSGACDIINAKDTLSIHRDEYIYYKTDHHWTSYGAYLAYRLFAEKAGFRPLDYESLSPRTVDGFLGTSYSKAKNAWVEPDTITYFDFDAELTVGGETHDGLYNSEQFTKRDKYAAFLYGNSPYTEIDSGDGEGKKESLLVIKDSYADCLVPYLTEHYRHITLVDLRYFKGNMSELRDSGFDDILIIYGFSDMCNDVNIPLLSIYED